MSTVTTKLNLSGLIDKISRLSRKTKTLKVGFLQSEEATKAAQNEFGGVYPVSAEYRSRAEAKGVHLNATIDIIPRPFMAVTVKNNSSKWMKFLLNKMKSNTPDAALKILGEEMVVDIQDTITSNNFEDNPAHIAKIKGRSKPLIDSGDMFNSVAFEVK